MFHILRHLVHIFLIPMDQCSEIQIIGQKGILCLPALKPVRNMVQQPVRLLIPFLGDQELCLEQAEADVILVHGHQLLHQTASLLQPCAGPDLPEPKLLIGLHQLNNALLSFGIRSAGKMPPAVSQRHRNRQCPIGIIETDLTCIQSSMTGSCVKKHLKRATIVLKIRLCQDLLLRVKKIPPAFHMQYGIAPAVPQDAQFLLQHRAADLHLHMQLALLRQKFNPLLLIRLYQEFFHMLFASLIDGKRPVILPAACITPRKDPLKLRSVIQLNSLLPVAFRQIRKMEQVADTSDGRLRHRINYRCHKGKVIFPLIADDIKGSFDYISLFKILPVKAEKNLSVHAGKFPCQTFHPPVRGKNASIDKLPLLSIHMEGALANLPFSDAQFYLGAGKIKRAILIVEIPFQYLFNSLLFLLLHYSSPVSASD